MLDGIRTSLSALQAHSAALGAAANNVANAFTPGYRRLDASFEPAAQGGARVSLTQGPPPADGEPDVELASEILDTIVLKAGLQANASMVKSQNEALGSLLDTFG